MRANKRARRLTFWWNKPPIAKRWWSRLAELPIYDRPMNTLFGVTIEQLHLEPWQVRMVESMVRFGPGIISWPRQSGRTALTGMLEQAAARAIAIRDQAERIAVQNAYGIVAYVAEPVTLRSGDTVTLSVGDLELTDDDGWQPLGYTDADAQLHTHHVHVQYPGPPRPSSRPAEPEFDRAAMDRQVRFWGESRALQAPDEDDDWWADSGDAHSMTYAETLESIDATLAAYDPPRPAP